MSRFVVGYIFVLCCMAVVLASPVDNKEAKVQMDTTCRFLARKFGAETKKLSAGIKDTYHQIVDNYKLMQNDIRTKCNKDDQTTYSKCKRDKKEAMKKQAKAVLSQRLLPVVEDYALYALNLVSNCLFPGEFE